MRMIPLMNSDLPSHTKKKIARMTHKQEQFLSTLIVKPCVYLSEIDYYNTELKTTLREIVMNLETLRTFDKDGNPFKIFQNVDYSSWHSSYVVTFPSHLEKEAEDYITQLPAYLKYIYGEEVLYMLTAEGSVAANQSTWDEDKLCATSNLDLELDAIDLESSNKSWLKDISEEIIAFDTSQIEMQGKLHQRSTDADSISTFASKVRAPIIHQIEIQSANDSNSQHQDKDTDNENQEEENEELEEANEVFIENDEESTSSCVESSDEEDHQARKPVNRDEMNTSRSAVSNLEGVL